MKNKVIGGFFILVALVIILTIAYQNSHKKQQPEIFSTTYMLSALWASYKKEYIEASSGRTLDPQRGNITTSEGQSYTMLRAVWEDDKTTFDSSWQWTLQNLKQPNDNLFSWLYGQKADGSYGILTDQGGANSASDADSDIALALLEASARWQDPSYLAQAKSIVSDIWVNEVVTVNGVPYMTADNLEKNSGGQILIDPSYLSPYSYRLFAQIDPTDDWNAVVDSSYNIINESSSSTLGLTKSVGLPPDWVVMNRVTGNISASTATGTDTNFGYDALRVPFRLALDYQWNNDPRDKAALEKFSFLSEQWQSNGLLYSTYAHDGTATSTIEAPAMYGGTIGYFMVTDPQTASDVYTDKLVSLYNPDYQDWKQLLGYYDSNWAWFGLALYNHDLNNYYTPSTN